MEERVYGEKELEMEGAAKKLHYLLTIGIIHQPLQPASESGSEVQDYTDGLGGWTRFDGIRTREKEDATEKHQKLSISKDGTHFSTFFSYSQKVPSPKISLGLSLEGFHHLEMAVKEG